jgi:hypothetical protein
MKNQTLKSSAPFRPFFDKLGKSSALEFPGPTKFFSALLELCGRKFGPLATLDRTVKKAGMV